MSRHRTDPDADVRLLLEIAETLNAGEGFEAGLERVLERVARDLDATAAGLCVRSNESPRRGLRVAFARPGSRLETARVDSPGGVRRRVLDTGISLRGDDLREEPEYAPAIDRRFGIEPRSYLVVPLRVRDDVIGALYVVRVERRAFDTRDQQVLEAIASKLAVWVQNDVLLRELHDELAERKLLMRVSRQVGETIELERVLELVFDALRPEVPFDAAAIFLTSGDDGSLEMNAQRGYETPEAIRHVPQGRGIIGRVQRTLHGALIDDVREHTDYLEARPATRSEMAVPIVSAGRSIGVINLESDRVNAYDARSLRIAEAIAGQVSSAVANARLHASRLERLQVEHELGLAREIQLSLLPEQHHRSEGIEISAVNVPSSAVGGDYYDYLVEGQDHAVLVLADVSGHGLSAALLTASMRTGFRLLARQTRDPAEIARRLSEALYESSPANQFVAAVIAVLDLQTGTLRYCNAGHIPPLLVGPAGETRSVWGGGIPLGLLHDAAYETRQTELRPGELLAFYTDGISEAEDDHGEQLGVDAVHATFLEHRDQPLGTIVNATRLLVRGHRGRRGGHLDDITLLTARWTGPSRADDPDAADDR